MDKGHRMTSMPKTEVEMLLRLRLAEAEVLCRECEELIEDNANIEAQLASVAASESRLTL